MNRSKKIIALSQRREDVAHLALVNQIREAGLIVTNNWPKTTLDFMTHQDNALKLARTFMSISGSSFPYFRENVGRIDCAYKLLGTHFRLGELFKARDEYLFVFCRFLIPVVSHPDLEKASIPENTLADTYDALTILVIMNTIIDDISDGFGSKFVDLINQMGRLIDNPNTSYTCNSKFTNEQNEACKQYFDLYKDLWKDVCRRFSDICHVKSVTDDLFFKEEILGLFKRVQDNMLISNGFSQFSRGEIDGPPIKTFDAAMEAFSPGMLISIFVAFQHLVITHNLNREFGLQSFAQYKSEINLVEQCCRLANDFASLRREVSLKQLDLSNTLVFLMDDEFLTDLFENNDLDAKAVSIQVFRNFPQLAYKASEMFDSLVNAIQDAKLRIGCHKVLILYRVLGWLNKA